MKPAAEQFAQALEQTAIELPRIPVIQNVNAGIAADVAQLGQALTAQLYQSVQWTQTMNTYKIRVLNISWNVAQATYWRILRSVYRISKKHSHSTHKSYGRCTECHFSGRRENCMTQERKVALVTGASRGIGAAIAQQLIQDGFFVVGTATSEAGAEKLSAKFWRKRCR